MAGPIPGKNCIQWIEPAEPSQHTWKDNYMCAEKVQKSTINNHGLTWLIRVLKVVNERPTQRALLKRFFVLFITFPCIKKYNSVEM